MTDTPDAVPPGLDARRPVSSFFGTIYGVLVRPDRFFTRFYSKELERTTGSIVFAVICSILSELLGVVTLFISPLSPTGGSLLDQDRFTIGIGLVVTLLLMVIIALIALAVGTIVQHLLTLPFIQYGEGIRATFVVVAYGINAVALFSWIPVIGYLALVYGLYVSTVGLREVHGTTTIRAFIPALIFVAIQILLSRPETLFSLQF